MKRIVIAGLIVSAICSGCRMTHPLVGPSDTIANVTVFPYCERLMNKYEKDKAKKKLVEMQIKAYRRLVEESKK